MILVLDNIRSAYNVGSIFRTAEFFGIETIYCCGITPDARDKKVIKTSLGAEKNLKIEKYKGATVRLVRKLKTEGHYILTLEQDTRSVNLQKFKIQKDKKYVLVVGNEVQGVSRSVLDIANVILEIKRRGNKESLNVATASAIAISQLTKIL